MITPIELKAGRRILLVGPRSMNANMLTGIAHLGERGALRVLDCGNQFNTFTVGCAARGRQEVLNHHGLAGLHLLPGALGAGKHTGNTVALCRPGLAQHVLQ